MFYLQKTIEISSAHCLKLPYESKCSLKHGHNWIVDIYCKSQNLNGQGMIIDFEEVKNIVKKFDHVDLNEVFSFNPTAENIAKYLCNRIPNCYRVTIRENNNNLVTYEN